MSTSPRHQFANSHVLQFFHQTFSVPLCVFFHSFSHTCHEALVLQGNNLHIYIDLPSCHQSPSHRIVHLFIIVFFHLFIICPSIHPSLHLFFPSTTHSFIHPSTSSSFYSSSHVSNMCSLIQGSAGESHGVKCSCSSPEASLIWLVLQSAVRIMSLVS